MKRCNARERLIECESFRWIKDNFWLMTCTRLKRIVHYHMHRETLNASGKVNCPNLLKHIIQFACFNETSFKCYHQSDILHPSAYVGRVYDPNHTCPKCGLLEDKRAYHALSQIKSPEIQINCLSLAYGTHIHRTALISFSNSLSTTLLIAIICHILWLQHTKKTAYASAHVFLVL